MTTFQIVAFYVALHLILAPILMFRVGQVRIKEKINLGDGDNPTLFAHSGPWQLRGNRPVRADWPLRSGYDGSTLNWATYIRSYFLPRTYFARTWNGPTKFWWSRPRDWYDDDTLYLLWYCCILIMAHFHIHS